MSKETAIEVNNLSKVYKLYDNQRDVIKEAFHPLRRKYHKKFYALKNISFNLEKGEVLGIIGKNGSGKSTLLKILASVVTPTSGSFNCYGRLSTLLELGGGFNKDLTGIENIYFLGAIQGYSKKEISAWLPQILEFAEIGEYAYQPVKSYSSGMYVRLTFSVAIHINPEILITDEALAVGDLRFQQKCFRRIREFKESGKTIVIVSHSMSKIKEYCTRAIWLHQGKIKMEGDPESITNAYMAFMNSGDRSSKVKIKQHKDESFNISKKVEKLIPVNNDISWYSIDHLHAFGTENAQIKKVGVANLSNSNNPGLLSGGEKIRIFLIIECEKQLNNPGIHLILNGQVGAPIFKINTYANNQKISLDTEEMNMLTIDFTFPEIGNGEYSLSIVAVDREGSSDEYLHWVQDVLIFRVDNVDRRHKQGSIVAIKDVSLKLLTE